MSRNPHHSRHQLYTKNPCIPPQNIQNAPISANYVKFADHFSIGPRGMETSNFTANCAKFA